MVIAFEGGFFLSLFQHRAAWSWAIAAVLVHAGALVFMGIVFPAFPVLCAAFVPRCDALRRGHLTRDVGRRARTLDCRE